MVSFTVRSTDSFPSELVMKTICSFLCLNQRKMGLYRCSLASQCSYRLLCWRSMVLGDWLRRNAAVTNEDHAVSWPDDVLQGSLFAKYKKSLSTLNWFIYLGLII